MKAEQSGTCFSSSSPVKAYFTYPHKKTPLKIKFHNSGGRRVVLHDQSIGIQSSDSRIHLHIEIQDTHSNGAEIKAYWCMMNCRRPYP